MTKQESIAQIGRIRNAIAVDIATDTDGQEDIVDRRGRPGRGGASERG